MVQAEHFCDEILNRWKRLANWAKYLSPEHEQKEREYGIPWRSAFKVEAKKELKEIKIKLLGLNEEKEDEDPFAILIQISNNGKQDAESFHQTNQAEMLEMVEDRLAMMEHCVRYLKKMLKEPDLDKFEHHRKEIYHHGNH